MHANIVIGSFYCVKLQINDNGYVTFGDPFNSHIPTQSPPVPTIAPFWADIDLSNENGTVCYNVLQRNDTQELAVVAQHLKIAGVTLQPTLAIVITWDNVSPYIASWYPDETCRSTRTSDQWHSHICNILVSIRKIAMVAYEIVAQSAGRLHESEFRQSLHCAGERQLCAKSANGIQSRFVAWKHQRKRLLEFWLVYRP